MISLYHAWRANDKYDGLFARVVLHERGREGEQNRRGSQHNHGALRTLCLCAAVALLALAFVAAELTFRQRAAKAQ